MSKFRIHILIFFGMSMKITFGPVLNSKLKFAPKLQSFQIEFF